MGAAAVLRKIMAVARPEALLTRAEVLTRYRHLREISKRHHSAVLDFLAKDAIIFQARRIGLAQGKTLVLDSIDDLNLAFDLAIHTAPKAGVLVPLDSELIENAVANAPQLLRKRPDEVIDDRRFAEAIYRAALARGIMQQVAYQDGIAESG